MSTTGQRILIAGDGPVRLFAALLLGRAGIAVRLFGENSTPQEGPRAATTHPATLDCFVPPLAMTLKGRESQS
jgi:3-(3-hydroxy-phenyl)propionate hydroxylase